MRLYIFIVATVFFLFTYRASSQIIAIEAGAAVVPSHTPTWTVGASLEIPVTRHFSFGASYYRWDDNNDMKSLISQYPIRDQFHPDYVFPQLSIQNSYWSNNVFSLCAFYKPILTEKVSLQIGVGWSFIEYGFLTAGIGVPDAGNNFSTNNQLGFKFFSTTPSPQRFSGLIQTQYQLSDNFAIQGKIAAFGLEHCTATIGLCFMPWGSTSSLVDLFAPQQK